MPVEHLPEVRVDIRAAQFGDVYVVTACGELDLYGAAPLKTELDRIEGCGGQQVIVDLLSAPFVDSTALGVLVGTAKRLRASGGRVVLVSDDPRTLRVFQVTGLDGIFGLERTLSAAIDAAIADSNG